MISRRFTRLLALFAAAALVATLFGPATAAANGASGVVVVANRGSGDISVIDTETLSVQTVDLPGLAEPMYVNHDTRNDVVYVGDRASSTVVVLDDESFGVLGAIPVGDGVFHQWWDKKTRQLWVVGDTSQTVTVIDTTAQAVEATIAIPADIVADGGKPHDVFVSGKRAFVSIVGLADGSGVVLQYSTTTFAETGRVTTGGDPHVFVSGNKLYIASQATSTVASYQANTLEPRDTAPVPTSHGIFVAGGDVLVTNIAGGGTDAVFLLDKDLGIVDTTNTALPVPHNLTVDNSHQAWVTHSGATADQVSVIDLDGFEASATVTVGINPFGLAFVKD